MKERENIDRPEHSSESVNEFDKRAQRILDRLDRADEIFDELQTEKKKPDKTTGMLQELFEPIERGLKRLFSTSFSHVIKPEDGKEQPQPLIPERLTRYLRSCSDEQLAAITRDIESILRERNSI